MKKQKIKRGGRQKGPPSTRMSLYLEDELVKAIKAAALLRDVPEKMIVTDFLKPILIDGEEFLSVSAVNNALTDPNGPLGEYNFITREQYELVRLMLPFGIHCLLFMKVFSMSFIKDRMEFKEVYRDRRQNMVDFVRLFSSEYTDAEKAEAFIFETLDLRAEKMLSDLKGDSMPDDDEADSQNQGSAAQDAAAVVSTGKAARGFSLRNLFIRK